jgi:microsomal dipeptidase-like Zn-dependent dipeptidase
LNYFDLHCDSLTTALQHSGDMDADQLQVSLGKPASWEKHCQGFAVFLPDTIRGEDAWNYYQIVRHYFGRQLEESPASGSKRKPAPRSADHRRRKNRGCLYAGGWRHLGGKMERLAEVKADGVKIMTLTWNGENELGFGARIRKKGLITFGIEAIRRGAYRHWDRRLPLSARGSGMCSKTSPSVIATIPTASALRAQAESGGRYFREIARRGDLSASISTRLS